LIILPLPPQDYSHSLTFLDVFGGDLPDLFLVLSFGALFGVATFLVADFLTTGFLAAALFFEAAFVAFFALAMILLAQGEFW